MVEQLICNQQVAGSSPIASSATEAIKEDRAPNIYICATATYSEGFPSGQRDQTVNLASLTSKVRILLPPQETTPRFDTRGSSSIGRAPAFQAGCRGFEPRLPLRDKQTTE